MKYGIVQHRNINGLNKLVNKALMQGWELQGGVSLAYMNDRYSVYCQAVVSQHDEQLTLDEDEKIAKEPETLARKIISVVILVAIVVGLFKFFSN